MRNAAEMQWKKLEGRIFHMRIDRVCSYGPGEIQVSFELIETEDHLNFIVECEDD